ncbi:MAG: carboxymuconolactone decarboxylase family protein [Alphaproteobacteria bacterium]|nr:MAG: carboxymuconolactone decarboxylase family protein [Alphaproteobacteria bacterium]
MTTTQHTTPRLPGVPPASLDEDGAEFDAVLRQSVERYFKGFVLSQDDGTLIGPFPAMQRFPELGRPLWDVFLALAEKAQLDPTIREVIILTVGAHTGAGYELYSHEISAARSGLSDSKTRALVARRRPADLTDAETAAYDVTSILLQGRQVPNGVYADAVAQFGERGTAEIGYLTGCYQAITSLLNLFDVSVPANPA